jgi:hypothetical protein
LENDLAFGAHKHIALAAWLMVAGMAMDTGAQAQQLAGASAASTLALRPADRTRPAPVSGKVLADPAAVALRPAAALPAAAAAVTPVSTATQVPAPKGFTDPALAPQPGAPATPVGAQPGMQASTQPTHTAARMHKAGSAASAAATEPLAPSKRRHVDRTRGEKKPSKTKGHPTGQKAKGQRHVGLQGGPSAKALAQARTKPHRRAAAAPVAKVVGHEAAPHHGRQARPLLPTRTAGKGKARTHLSAGAAARKGAARTAAQTAAQTAAHSDAHTATARTKTR